MGCCFGKSGSPPPPRRQELRDSEDGQRRPSGGRGGGQRQQRHSAPKAAAPSSGGGRRLSSGLLQQKVSMAAKTGSLNLSEAGISEVPTKQLTDAGATKLRVADLSVNRLVALDERFIATFNQLKQLILHHNQIGDISPVVQLAQLEVLDCSHNQLTVLPALSGLRSLKELNLGNNSIAYCNAAAFTGTPRLRVLDLSANRLETLPESLFSLGRLEHLNVADNELAVLGDGEQVAQLKELRYLECERNRIVALPEELFAATKLNQLGLEGNPLTLEQLKDMVAYDQWCERQRGVVNKQLQGGAVAKLN
eukprot:TRINITY_DN70521_c0_g1_i1.p1 TRINITY_DN70521_c0_g1~~TRINITY_DN70521_c0_g1_i1.p1  ORF type:complete len:308 (+),score=97.72 TRINITY_DN70521_c0_g1_i1:71-994(+)